MSGLLIYMRGGAPIELSPDATGKDLYDAYKDELGSDCVLMHSGKLIPNDDTMLADLGICNESMIEKTSYYYNYMGDRKG